MAAPGQSQIGTKQPETAGIAEISLPLPAAAPTDAVPPGQPWAGTSLQALRAALQRFTAERDWQQFHTPRNLVLALVGEVGELAECFQWKAEVAAGLPSFSADERRHVGEELSDVLLYLVRLADACGIDLAAAAADKMGKNAAKYPAQACRGSAAKYTAYAAGDERAAVDAGRQGEQRAGLADGGQAAGDGGHE